MRTPRVLALAVLLAVPSVASAANPHFIGDPTFTVSNNTITACATVAGLGNQDVTVRLTATATVQCINKGGNPPPGQRLTASGKVDRLHPENGKVSFCVTTDRLNPNCPDGMKFTATFSNIQIQVIQNGSVVLSQSFQ